jgi:hypothetical protein
MKVLYEGEMVPTSLRAWFVIHFVADLLAAIPLFFAPETVLGWLGWTVVDPVATRAVAAALFGIGIESYLGRNGTMESFQGMLRLKVIWSAMAALGTLWSLLRGAPPAAWAVFGIFAAFHAVWLRYLLLLRRR